MTNFDNGHEHSGFCGECGKELFHDDADYFIQRLKSIRNESRNDAQEWLRNVNELIGELEDAP